MHKNGSVSLIMGIIEYLLLYFQVCTNGYVTFNTPFYDWWPPGDISDISDRTLLAPYFGDVDIRGIYGAVYYQAYTSFSNGTSPKLAIQLAEAYVRQLMRNKDFNARFVLVVTWHQAPPYPYHDGWWCWLFGWSCENTKVGQQCQFIYIQLW